MTVKQLIKGLKKYRPDMAVIQGGVLLFTESGDQHIIPLTSDESKAMIRDGEMECNKHTEEPGCFCEPFPTLKNENIWIHRKRG